MTIGWVLQKIRNRISMVTVLGSPTRYFVKLWAYASRPREYLRRVDEASKLPKEVNESEVVRQLKLDGFSLVVDFEYGDELYKSIEEKMKKVNGEGLMGEPLAARDYFRVVAAPAERTTDDILTRFALQPKILNTITAYLGSVPVLEYIEVIASHDPQKGSWVESQLWHRDRVDSRNPKLFVYMTDVLQPEDGPFTYIPARESRKVRNKIVARRISDEDMERQGLSSKAKAVYGQHLTAFISDVGRCYHLGSRCKNVRVAYMASFVTHASFTQFKTPMKITRDLSPIEQLVIRSR